MNNPHFPPKVPLLTPSTNKKVGEALKLPYANWSFKATELSIPTDPNDWTVHEVSVWLDWTMKEFSLDSAVYIEFQRNFKVKIRFVNVIQWTPVIVVRATRAV